MNRVSYWIINTGWGWRDVDSDRTVTRQIGDTVHTCKVRDLEPDDIVRGLRDSRMMTGAPVRILKNRRLA